ncbi:hypothetical protein N0V86_006565 [Didymella sp. IMI 355093]|nr:hypothetical protein N0V86_006565 [Didymella sp. IMI 355093]
MTNEFDNFKRARELKASILQSTPSPSLQQRASVSTEDALIIHLRSSGKAWSEIVTALNTHRASNKEAATWTESAAYSRFVLNTSQPVMPAREVGFEPRDYAHLRSAGSGREGAGKAGKKRVKDFQNATELSANIRKPALIEGAGSERAENEEGNVKGKGKVKAKGKGKGKGKGKDEDRRKGESEVEIVKVDKGTVEMLMRAVAKVERNFWAFVADEFEREGGRYIEPKELEKVFHKN